MSIVKVFVVLSLFFSVAYPVFSQDVVEILSPSFKNRSHNAVMYSCLEPSQVPDVYHGGGYSLMKMPLPASELGLSIAIYGDNSVFLTSVECLGQVKEAAENRGIDAEDLRYSNIAR